MGAAAVNVGRQDLLDGLPLLEKLAKDPGVPWVSANLRRRDGSYPVSRWRTAAWGGLKVGVFGLLRPLPSEDARLGLEISDPEAAAREALKALAGSDAVVCLSNLGLVEELRLAAAVPGITAVVGGGSGEYLAAPQVSGSTLILHAGERGKHLGVLDLASAGLTRGGAAPRSLQDLAELQRLKGEVDGARAVYSHRVTTLEPSAGEDSTIAGWVREYKAAEAAWAQNAAAVVVPPPLPPPARRPGGGGALHVGSAACRPCHAGAYRRWLGTAHSRSSLAIRGRETERQCLECHATALSLAGGPQNEPSVGCEACHGPGGNHRAAGNIARKPPEALCRQCHRGFHAKESFEYGRGYAKVRCDGT